MAADFLARVTAILNALRETQQDPLSSAATQMASTLAGGGLIHLFGSGHSMLPVMDAFPRYGSFVGFNPLTDPRLSWSSVDGPGGLREMLWLERAEGYVGRFLSHEPICAGDTMIVFSHSGRNAAPVEAAAHGRDRGATVIAVTSAKSLALPATHSSGRRLTDIADLVIDTGVPADDALISVEGWPSPVAGASTIVACACMGELIALVAGMLAERGIVLPTFASAAAGDTSGLSTDEIVTAHQQRRSKAIQRSAAPVGHRP